METPRNCENCRHCKLLPHGSFLGDGICSVVINKPKFTRKTIHCKHWSKNKEDNHDKK